MDLGRRSVAEWTEDRSSERPAFRPAKQKYEIHAPLGKGGMGEVLLATDNDLRRQVAVKLLREDIGSVQDQLLHFVAEAQATSQLEHPGIPPVHDIGTTENGRPWFTMKLIRGRTLKDILHDLLIGRREVASEYTLHRLVSILERICEALHFAHERGVLHRDIKPENVMLGDYGEVHLMDWGLARVGADTGEIDTARVDSGLETQYGSLKGTPPYMSPEQLLGQTDAIDKRADVYALGCLLYEMLTLHAAFDPSDLELFAKVQMGSYPDPAERNPRRAAPEPLADICRIAMAKVRDDRYESADEMREALRAWLDGRAERERRHQEAERLATQGKVAAADYERLKAEVGDAEAAAEVEAAKFKPYQPIAEKRSLIEARDRVETLKTDVALAFAETTHLFNAALMQEPDNATARAALAGIWKHRLADAEQLGDRADTAYALALVERYSDSPVSSDGSLTLTSDPPGAEVLLYRYEPVDGVLTPRDERHLGATPLGPVPLPMGSYLCVLKNEGFRDTRYPVHITRDRAWEGEVRLRTDEEIGEGFVYVPGGPFICGEGKETETKDLPDFAIARYPVTYAEYGEFLDSLDEEEAQKRCPNDAHMSYMEMGEDGKWRPNPDGLDEDYRKLYLDRHGRGFELRMPAVCVSWGDAAAYSEWKAKRTGHEWRLPTEEEREKAARGVDGRRCAWGEIADPSLGKCAESRPENTRPEPVGAFVTAESVYGMGDASGGVWDWTDSWLDERHSSRAVRGGSWNVGSAALACAMRRSSGHERRAAYIGFRCARSFPPSH